MAAIDSNQPINTGGFELPKVVKKAKSTFETAESVVYTTSSIVSVVDSTFKKIPGPVMQTFDTMVFVSAGNAVFAIPSLVSNVSKAVFANSIVERVKSSFRALLDAGALWIATNSILSGLRSVGVLAAGAIS